MKPKLIYWKWSGAHNRQRTQWMCANFYFVIYNTHNAPWWYFLVIRSCCAELRPSARVRCAVTRDIRLGSSSSLVRVLTSPWVFVLYSQIPHNVFLYVVGLCAGLVRSRRSHSTSSSALHLLWQLTTETTPAPAPKLKRTWVHGIQETVP